MVAGALDAGTSHQLRQQCERIDPNDAETVLLDLADVTDIDSSGVDALVAAHAHFGERLVILSAPPCAQAIEFANVRDRLPIVVEA